MKITQLHHLLDHNHVTVYLFIDKWINKFITHIPLMTIQKKRHNSVFFFYIYIVSPLIKKIGTSSYYYSRGNEKRLVKQRKKHRMVLQFRCHMTG